VTITRIATEPKGHFVHVTEQEALVIIHSLSGQLKNKSSNYDRSEQYTESGEYFSIGVRFKPERPQMIHPCDCTSYNGGQCYNCLNGFHSHCEGKKKCETKDSKSLGLKLTWKSPKKRTGRKK
jgi:hypothetical protein